MGGALITELAAEFRAALPAGGVLMGLASVGLILLGATGIYLWFRTYGERVIGEALEPLAGAVVEASATASPGPENTVGIVAEMTPTTPGTYQLTSVRLRFRVNGGGEQSREGISVFWTVCADDPAPDCDPAETEP